MCRQLFGVPVENVIEVSSHSSLRGAVALAFADEVIARPGLLERYAARFSGDDEITLVVYAPDADPAELERDLGPVVTAAGLDGDAAADVMALAVPSDPVTVASILDSASFILSERLPSAPFDCLPTLGAQQPEATRDTTGSFRCNICGESSAFRRGTLDREHVSCTGCSSTPRFRGVVHALSTGLFGRGIPLPEFPERRDLRGAGLSDWSGYSHRLEEKFDYTNTFLHTEPRLDILDPDPALVGALDFLISSEVFEHVPPPAGRAFEASFRLLKPGGLLVLTVPYGVDGETVEHFPDLHDWTIVERGDRRVLVNTTIDGRVQEFEDLVFHGGDGLTLEMRVWSLSALRRELQAAGFVDVQVFDEDVEESGFCWPGRRSRPILARRPASKETPDDAQIVRLPAAVATGLDPGAPGRANPGTTAAPTMREHALRYAFALDLVAGRDALDLGCGTGYGSEMLAWTARSVTGFDSWVPENGERPLAGGRAGFVYGHDLCADPLPRADVAVMYEVLEHLADGPGALRRLFTAVSSAVVSFRNPTDRGGQHNLRHVNDWSLDEVERRIEDAASVRIGDVEIEHFHQADDGLIRRGREPKAQHWILVVRCREERPATPARDEIARTPGEAEMSGLASVQTAVEHAAPEDVTASTPFEPMKRDGNARAAENARQYVAGNRVEWGEEDLRESGRVCLEREIGGELDRFTGGRDPQRLSILEVEAVAHDLGYDVERMHGAGDQHFRQWWRRPSGGTVA